MTHLFMPANDDELIAVVGTSDKSGARFHASGSGERGEGKAGRGGYGDAAGNEDAEVVLAGGGVLFNGRRCKTSLHSLSTI